MLLLCLLRTPLRWSGAVIAALACVWVMATPRADILITADGQAAAYRASDGQLAVLHAGRDTFAIKEWLAADGDARMPKDPSLQRDARCDEAGCIGRLGGGRLVSMALTPEAFAEDCTRAAVVMSAREAPGVCAALLIDRKIWRTNGAMALRWTGASFEQTAARPPGYERPWTHMPQIPADATQTSANPAARDATPKADDLEAGD
jgi:competence protein ComEC